jgi:SSS family solute:Na+ symporter
MAGLDLAIVSAYLMLMLAIGIYYRAYAAKDLDTFFLAGRSIPGWLNGVSYAAAMVSTDAATAYGGLAVVTGVFVCWWYLSRFGLALFIGAVLFAFFWRRLGFFTSLEFYEQRFTGRAAAFMRLWIAFRTSFIAMTAWTGITLLASAKILGPTLGLGKLETLLLIVPISFAYIFLSGYKGVVVSNLLQMAIFLLGATSLAWLTVLHFGGPNGFAAAIVHQFGAEGRDMLGDLPPLDHAVFPLTAAWLVGQSIGYGGDAAPMSGAMEGQRILSSKDPKHAAFMYVVSAVTMFTLVLLVSLPCLGAAVLWPSLRDPAADRELAYGLLMKELLPSGFVGLLAAAMLAGVMSTVGDNLNFGGQVMLNDIYRRWLVKNASEKHYLMAGKLCMLVILGMAIAVVYNVRIIFDVAVFMLQLSAAEMSANWAQWWWWRFNSKARIAASFGGGLIFVIVVLCPKLLLSLGYSWAKTLVLPWWYATFLVMALTTALWVSVALLTAPDPEKTLIDFHRKAQPLGSWGPVRVAAKAQAPLLEEEPEGQWMLVFKGFGIAVAGALSVMLFILSVSNLFIGRYSRATLMAVGCGLGIVLFARWMIGYLGRLQARSDFLTVSAEVAAAGPEAPDVRWR